MDLVPWVVNLEHSKCQDLLQVLHSNRVLVLDNNQVEQVSELELEVLVQVPVSVQELVLVLVLDLEELILEPDLTCNNHS